MSKLFTQVEKVILASSSQIRKRILSESGIDFEVVKPIFDEDGFKKENPEFIAKLTPKNLAIFLAQKKALSVSEKFPKQYVIGSDQVCEFEEKEFSKSNNAQEAVDQLTKFSGKYHFQNNALVVAKNGKIVFQNFSRVKLLMRKISVKEIESYVSQDQSWGSAGSYKYESQGKHLFEKVSGDYFAILGLSIQPLLAFFYKKNIIKINQ